MRTAATAGLSGGQFAAVRCLQLAIENVKTCPERAKRVEWIEHAVVPVVQRIERRFPKP
jgi:hypothetical protein